MTVQYVQSAIGQGSSGGTSVSASLSGVGAGHALRAIIIGFAYGTTVTSISDTQGNTYNLVQSIAGVGAFSSYYVWDYVASNVVGGAGSNTLSVSLSQGSSGIYPSLYFEEIGGCATAPVDVAACAAQATPAASISSGSATNTKQPALISGFCTLANTPSAGSGFNVSASGSFSSGLTYVAENLRVTADASQAATFTQVSSYQNAMALMVVFDELSAVVKVRKTLTRLGSRLGSRQLQS